MVAESRRDLRGRGVDGDVVRPVLLLRRWWLLFAGAALLGAGLGWILNGVRGAEYESAQVVLIGTLEPDADTLEAATDLARTYGEVVESRSVIERAVSGLPIESSAVSVAASAGRGSATLTIRVRTSSRDLSPRVVEAVVDELESIVEDAGVTLAPGGQAPAAETPSTGGDQILTVIDDGAGRAVDKSLALEFEMVMGAIAAVLFVGACALASETRRDARTWSASFERVGSQPLGAIELPPSVFAFLTGRRKRAISSDAPAVHEAALVADHIQSDGGRDTTRPRIFVTAPTGDRAYIRGFVQLVAGFEDPPRILDPSAAISNELLRRETVGTEWRYGLRADSRAIAHLIVPTNSATHPAESVADAARLISETDNGSMADDGGAVVVFMPATHEHPSWRFWAGACDRAVVLAREHHLGDAILPPLITRVRGAQPRLCGGVVVRRRWFVGRPVTVRMDLTTPIGRLLSPSEQARLAARS